MRQKMVLLCMVSAVHSSHVKQLFFRSSSIKLDSFQVLDCFNLSKLNNKFSTHSLFNYVVKFRVHHSSLSRTKLEEDLVYSFSKMSFYNPTGLRVSARNNGVIPGTSVCFQFWITNDMLRLVAVCILPQPTRFAKMSRNIQTLRHFELLDGDNYYNQESGIKVRVMNYNVLSQTLLEVHHYLYQNQSSEILAWDNRSQIILAEILAVNPDILCLQEVDAAHISTFYRKLENYGYRVVTKMKTGHKPDGLAILYRVPDIKLLETETVEYRQPGVVQLASRDNVGLIVKLEKDGKKFIVANTHLLYNPRRTEIRLAQLQMFLAEVDRIKRNDSERIEVLLMGDLNSTPESPIVRLLTDGKLLSSYRPLPTCLGISPECVHMQQESKLYHSQKQFRAPCEGNEEILPIHVTSSALNQSYLLSHNFKFLSVYNLTENEKRGVTTFQDKWVLVDYMFYTSGIKLASRLHLPTASESNLYVHFLPNEVNPSDHLPLVAEFVIY